MANQDFPTLHNLTTEINAEHGAVSGSGREKRERAISIGRKLLELKRRLAHGEFLSYFEANLTFGRRKATEYMDAARNEVFIRKLEEASNLDEASLPQALAQAKELRKRSEGRD